MKLIERFGYYFGGFSVGLIILAFFLNGKHVSCAYGPQARVLKNISTKQIVYSNAVNSALSEHNMDSLAIPYVLKHGSIDFDERARQKPCGIYDIEGEYNNREFTITVKNCDSIATILKISMP